MSTDEPVLRVSGLAKSYSRGREVTPVLWDLNWTLEPNRSVAIVGVSGSGKSTLLNLLAGFDRPSAGTVEWLGRGNIATLSEPARKAFYREHVGFVFQKLNLLPDLTAFQNIFLALTLSGKTHAEAEDAARRVALALDIEDLLGFRVSEMSLGQAQRVAIARALAKRPTIILADEPTGSVDAKNAASVLDLMLQGRAQMRGTLVLVTHDTAVAARCDTVLRLDNGRLGSG